MNEVALSNNLQQIEKEITHHKQRAGESIWEIGRRLNHVKENDLVHGEFMTWYKSMDLTEDFVSKSTRIAKELSNFESSRNLGIEALYLIATLPEGEREKEHKLVSGETKKAHEMTVRELQEVRRRNRQMEKELAKLKDDTVSADEIKERLRQQEIEAQRNKHELEQARKELANASKPEVEYVEVEKHVDNTDYDRMRELERKAEIAERERKKAEEEARRLKEAEETRLRKEEEERLAIERKEREKEEEIARKRAEYEQRVKEASQNKRDQKVDIFNTDEKFRVIYADPAWSYNDKQNTDKLGGAAKHYDTMSIEEISSLPVKDITEDDAVLFIWVTSPLLEESFEVINSWGFEYKSSFVWDKIAHNMGHYNSVRHEFLLIATKGRGVPDKRKLYDSVQSIERTRHSAKPIEFMDIIDDIYEYGDRVELFAREGDRKGWKYWGNEV